MAYQLVLEHTVEHRLRHRAKTGRRWTRPHWTPNQYRRTDVQRKVSLRVLTRGRTCRLRPRKSSTADRGGGGGSKRLGGRGAAEPAEASASNRRDRHLPGPRPRPLRPTRATRFSTPTRCEAARRGRDGRWGVKKRCSMARFPRQRVATRSTSRGTNGRPHIRSIQHPASRIRFGDGKETLPASC